MIAPATMVSWLLVLALKASLLIAGAFVITALLRGVSAASRHVVWLAAFVGVLALPLAGAVMPSWRVPVLAPRTSATPVAAVAGPVVWTIGAGSGDLTIARAALAALAAPPTPPSPAVPPVPPSPPAPADVAWHSGITAISLPTPAAAPVAPLPTAAAVAPAAWPMRVFLLWTFGFILVAVAFAVGVLRTHVMACTALPVHGDDLADEVEVLSASLGIVRGVRLMTWPGAAMPMTWGALRPVVLLPESARQWPAARRHEVLTHELAHVRRGDWIARLIAALACAIHWFNPLVWMAASRMRYEQELACDDTVLAGGVQPSDYATHLLEVARSLRVPGFAVANASVAMARPSQLTGRLLAVLDESRARVAAAPRRTAGLAWALGVLAVATVGAAAPVERAAPPPAAAPFLAAPAWGVEAATPTAWAVPAEIPEGMPTGVAGVAPVAAAAAAMRQDRCDELLRGNARRGSASGGSSGRGRSTNSSHSSTSSNSSDDAGPNRATLSISDGDCRIEMRMVGTVRFSDDDAQVLDVSRDGSIRVTQEGDGPDRRFEAFWRNGQLQRAWRVDGREVSESEELRTWLAGAMQTLFVRTGWNAPARVMRAYRAGGIDSALVLAQSTGSDYAKRQMLMALIDSARVPPAEAARIARQAQDMSSDYERAELLIAVAQKLRLDGPVQEAMIEGSTSMSSDYERGRVLSAALAREGLSVAAAQALLRSAGQMSSDYEKAQLLIRYLRAAPLDESRRTLFFAATRSIGSDYERRRVLSEAVARDDTPVTMVADVIAASDGIGSDYEHAELLVQLTRRFGTNADVRQRVRRAADTVGSEHERNRIYAQLMRVSQ